ncbi:SIR2 family protein [Sphingobium subterraneum]|uniref:NAD(+) hydrolase ThsA n=1 Tax=Sphingobium subterraneum TaxID=627688 RepID=A0A841J821_9SPHN|nr:SIR2 family protein [Sphingobium subterraneum]MBB6124675.1 hypothetical protein [Sphingobium subterraneum]
MNGVVDEFIGRFLTELREDNAAVFVGAGLSKAAGFVDWRGLLAPIATPLGLDVEKENDLVGLAQFHLNTNAGNRNQLNQLLIEQFADLPAPTENHRLLARLPIRSYWTTNYDRLIEQALKDCGKRVDAKYTVEQLSLTVRGRDAIVYKMHGDIEHADKAVLTKDDYERYAGTHAPFITALSGDLVERTFLFLGFSFTDPNLDYVLARIRSRFEKNQRQHFCIVKTRSKLPNESDADFAYAKTRQDLVAQDLLRFNIKTIAVEEFSDITKLLSTIVDRFRQQTVFISGSAADYGQWGQQETENFLMRLAAALIDRDCRINSGFGLGIGSAVVTGAVEQIYSNNQRSIDSHLLLRPFPAGIQDQAERERVFERYRTELIAQAGIAIFLIGNKLDTGNLVPADGMRVEFDLARNAGLHCLPIGASGGISADLWSEMMAELKIAYPERDDNFYELFERLGQKVDNPHELLDPLLQIIDILRKE